MSSDEEGKTYSREERKQLKREKKERKRLKREKKEKRAERKLLKQQRKEGEQLQYQQYQQRQFEQLPYVQGYVSGDQDIFVTGANVNQERVLENATSFDAANSGSEDVKVVAGPSWSHHPHEVPVTSSNRKKEQRIQALTRLCVVLVALLIAFIFLQLGVRTSSPIRITPEGILEPKTDPFNIFSVHEEAEDTPVKVSMFESQLSNLLDLHELSLELLGEVKALRFAVFENNDWALHAERVASITRSSDSSKTIVHFLTGTSLIINDKAMPPFQVTFESANGIFRVLEDEMFALDTLNSTRCVPCPQHSRWEQGACVCESGFVFADAEFACVPASTTDVKPIVGSRPVAAATAQDFYDSLTPQNTDGLNQQACIANLTHPDGYQFLSPGNAWGGPVDNGFSQSSPYVGTPTPRCARNWTYRDIKTLKKNKTLTYSGKSNPKQLVDQGENVVYQLSGCVSIRDYQPKQSKFLVRDELDAYSSDQLDLLWCPREDQPDYVKEASIGTEPKHDNLLWGLCTPCQPTNAPTSKPTEAPTHEPTQSPTNPPTTLPTESPTSLPTESPTESPTDSPTVSPTKLPTESPSPSPSQSPTKFGETLSPTPAPIPTPEPTSSPSMSPTPSPTMTPVAQTSAPTMSDDLTNATMAPTLENVTTSAPTSFNGTVTLTPPPITTSAPTVPRITTSAPTVPPSASQQATKSPSSSPTTSESAPTDCIVGACQKASLTFHAAKDFCKRVMNLDLCSSSQLMYKSSRMHKLLESNDEELVAAAFQGELSCFKESKDLAKIWVQDKTNTCSAGEQLAIGLDGIRYCSSPLYTGGVVCCMPISEADAQHKKDLAKENLLSAVSIESHMKEKRHTRKRLRVEN